MMAYKIKKSKKEKEYRNQLRIGTKVEMEHESLMTFITNYKKSYGRYPSPKKIAQSIALDHLQEDKKYYTKLRQAKL